MDSFGRRTSLFAVLCLIAAVVLTPRMAASAWGEYGHQISARAAVLALPSDMPAFFRDAIDQLVYLNAEPDRWRDPRETELDTALDGVSSPEHYVNLEIISPDALGIEDRYAFERESAGALPGFLSYRTLELFQRVRLEFRLWREEEDDQIRKWIQERIINDAGILGHYLTDAANPLHTTIHFDGWVGDNPEGYATAEGIHRRFESDYVDAHLALDDLTRMMTAPARVWEDPRASIREHIFESFGLVETLYQLDRAVRFGESTGEESHRQFALKRLASGALALRDAWWSAWVMSGF